MELLNRDMLLLTWRYLHPSLLLIGSQGLSFLRSTVTGAGKWLSPPSSAKIKNEWSSQPSLYHMLSWYAEGELFSFLHHVCFGQTYLILSCSSTDTFVFHFQVRGDLEITRKITATETTEVEHKARTQERVVQGQVVSVQISWGSRKVGPLFNEQSKLKKFKNTVWLGVFGMSIEHWWKDTARWKLKYWEKIPPHSHSSTTYPMWTGLRLNLDFNDERLMTYHMSSITAIPQYGDACLFFSKMSH